VAEVDAPAADSAELGKQPTPPAFEIIPLSFALPKNLSVADVEQDEAQTIYYLDDQWQDDIVLVLAETDTLTKPDGAAAISINGQTAWGLSEDGYQKLIFLTDGLLFELTCRYDINTLIALGKSIL
ncbi:MAG: hypothetical protein FWE69_02420, partial [Clostridiales bacterium]|nr:hypothetical protein [Clostridiales bacterium]